MAWWVSEIDGITPNDDYIELVFTGEAIRGFPKSREYLNLVLAAYHVVMNFAEVDYDMDSDIFGEQRQHKPYSHRERRRQPKCPKGTPRMDGIKMAEIESMIPHDGYIEVINKGVAIRGFPYVYAAIEEMVVFCREQECNKILCSFAKVEYEINTDIFAEHRLAEFLSQPRFDAIKWAFLLPISVDPTTAHVENAAVNRGVKLRTFLNRDEAIHWLTHD